ncbi:MAG: tyrosine-type recombinase/integrase [Pirellulales bacterium]|nr:tyrosine-type recombinase/integrase [Pirellulales bacterium]
MTVPSPKTEHHEGKATRQIPLFPELRQYLEEVLAVAKERTEFVITRYRSSDSNLRTQFERIIRRAGLEPWPKLFQNLRSTRETELAEEHPLHVVTAWMGNSQSVAAKHYLQVTDDHFARAAKGGVKSPTEGALQKAMQQPAAPASNGSHKKSTPIKNPASCGALHEVATTCVVASFEQVPPDGLEPSTL